MRLIGGIQHRLAAVQDGFGLAKMHHGRGKQTECRVAVFFVVPAEKLLAEGAAILDAAEAMREIGTVLQGSELAFGIGIVVGNVRPAMRLSDSQIGHKKGQRLGGHNPTAVGVEVELAGGDVMLADRLLDEPLGQFGAFAGRHHPASDIAAEDIEDDMLKTSRMT